MQLPHMQGAGSILSTAKQGEASEGSGQEGRTEKSESANVSEARIRDGKVAWLMAEAHTRASCPRRVENCDQEGFQPTSPDPPVLEEGVQAVLLE